MADTKISNLSELSEAPASTDLIAVVDVDDTSMAASGTTKKVTKANLTDGLQASITAGDGLSFTGTTLDAEVTQAELDAKQSIITGAATTVDSENLTTDRVVESNSSGKLAASAITTAELGTLDGITSNIQTQLDALGGTSGTVTEVLAGTGMTQTGTSTVNPTLNVVGTSNRITANANDIDIASTYVGQTSIHTLGTVTTGTWNGTAVDGVYVDLEGTELKSTGESATDKYLRTDGDGTCSWQTIAGGGSGDITSVVAGSGLTGGATSGDATLNVIGGDGITANADEIEVAVDDATIELGSGTVKAKTAAVTDGAGTLATGDQIYDFVTGLGYTTNTGDITEVAAGTGIAVSGGSSGTATVSMDDPANGTSIDEGTIATDDRMPIWDESASAWKYVTIDNLQDEIDTGGGGGGDTLPIVDSTAVVKDPSDATKLARIDAGAIATGTTRVITMADRDVDLADGGTFAESSHTHSGYLQASNNLSDVANASLVRANLSLVVGSNVQAYDQYNAFTNATQTFTMAQRGEVEVLADGATITPNFALGNNFSVELGGNRTLANPSSLTAGQSGAITITQDGTGSRTLAYGGYWKFIGGTAPTLTTTASAVDVLVYYVESSDRITAKVLLDVK